MFLGHRVSANQHDSKVDLSKLIDAQGTSSPLMLKRHLHSDAELQAGNAGIVIVMAG